MAYLTEIVFDGRLIGYVKTLNESDYAIATVNNPDATLGKWETFEDAVSHLVALQIIEEVTEK